MIDLTARLTFTVPLTQVEHGIAEEFRRQHNDPQKQKLVYLNTLAVYAVDFYLRCLGFETDLLGSDSCDSMMRSLMDVADLEVKNIGKIECRPVMPNSQICSIPLEVWSDRIGFVAVQLSESFREATLVGFVETVTEEEVLISEMRSIEDLVNNLEQLKTSEPVKMPVQLSRWFKGIIETGWQTVETLLATQEANLALNFRNRQISVRRGKEINLSSSGQSVALLVAIAPNAQYGNVTKSNSEMNILVEVYPPQGQAYLPPNLQLMVLDREGTTVMNALTRNTNGNIQLEFSGEPGEHFSIKMALGDVSMTEKFII